MTPTCCTQMDKSRWEGVCCNAWENINKLLFSEVFHVRYKTSIGRYCQFLLQLWLLTVWSYLAQSSSNKPFSQIRKGKVSPVTCYSGRYYNIHKLGCHMGSQSQVTWIWEFLLQQENLMRELSEKGEAGSFRTWLSLITICFLIWV